MTENTVTNVIMMMLPTTLDSLAAGIKADLERTEHGRNEWIEGTLGLAAKLKQARGEFGSNAAFSKWIADNAISINHQDRAALINMAENLDLARENLRNTKRSSWQHIWNEEMVYRFTQVSKTIQGELGNNSKSILDAIKDSPGVPGRELAQQLGVSHGKVQRGRRKLAAEALGKTKEPKSVGPTLAEQYAIRNARARFDDKTREERGMGSREYGAEQHPDYPPGWTRDVVHREIYGRIQLFTPSQQEERELARRFIEMIKHLARFIDAETPTADDLDKLNDHKNREPVMFQLRKLAPKAIDKLNGLLQKLAVELAPDRAS